MKIEDILLLYYGKKPEEASEKELLTSIELVTKYYAGKKLSEYQLESDYIFVTKDRIERPDVYKFLENEKLLETIDENVAKIEDFYDLLFKYSSDYFIELNKTSIFYILLLLSGFKVEAYSTLKSELTKLSFINEDDLVEKYGGNMNIYMKENGKFGINYENEKILRLFKETYFPSVGEGIIYSYGSKDEEYNNIWESINTKAVVKNLFIEGKLKDNIILGNIDLDAFLSEIMRILLDEYEYNWNEAVEEIIEKVTLAFPFKEPVKESVLEKRNTSILAELKRRKQIDKLKDLNTFKYKYYKDYEKLKVSIEELLYDEDKKIMSRNLNRLRLNEYLNEKCEIVLNESALYICDFMENEGYTLDLLNYLDNLYIELSENPNKDMVSTVFIFYAYNNNRDRIREIKEKINKDIRIKDKVKVILIENNNSFIRELVESSIDIGINADFFQEIRFQRNHVIYSSGENVIEFLKGILPIYRNEEKVKRAIEDNRIKLDAHKVYDKLFR